MQAGRYLPGQKMHGSTSQGTECVGTMAGLDTLSKTCSMHKLVSKQQAHSLQSSPLLKMHGLIDSVQLMLEGDVRVMNACIMNLSNEPEQ